MKVRFFGFFKRQDSIDLSWEGMHFLLISDWTLRTQILVDQMLQTYANQDHLSKRTGANNWGMWKTNMPRPVSKCFQKW